MVDSSKSGDDRINQIIFDNVIASSIALNRILAARTSSQSIFIYYQE